MRWREKKENNVLPLQNLLTGSILEQITIKDFLKLGKYSGYFGQKIFLRLELSLLN
jgi:hypothetical protein